MVDLTGITSGTGLTTSSANGSAAKLADDFDDFLTLLTTQLQNQDPTDPMDSNEFTNQLVQFSSVEQQIQTNQNLESLTNLMSMSNIASTASYLGNDALITGDTGDHDGQSGITWMYQNSVTSDNLTLEVRDSNGLLVYSEDGKKSAGLHTFEWNGLNNAGTAEPAGNYQLDVVAKDADGTEYESAIAVRETITAVDMSSADPVFTIGPNEVNQSNILQLFTKG